MTDKRQQLHDINLQQALASVSAAFEEWQGSLKSRFRPVLPINYREDLSQATFYGTRKTKVMEIKRGEAFGFAFEHDGTRYIVDFSEPGMNLSAFNKLQFNSSAMLQPLTHEEAEIALDVIESELPTEERAKFAPVVSALRRHLPEPTR